MRWPWTRRVETREGDLDTVIADAALTAAAGGTPRADRLAAAQAAAGLIGRAFASATVDGEAGQLLTAFLREVIGRSLVLRGEALLVAGQGATLIPAAGFDVTGNADPMTWRYRVDLSGPSGVTYRRLPFAEVLHFRVNADPATPWRGRSGFSLSSATARTATEAEHSAGNEAKVSVARLFQAPPRLHPHQREQSDRDLPAAVAKGGYFGISLKEGARPDVEPVHPDPSQGHLELRRQSALDLLAAAGIPAALADPRAEGTSQREAFRRLVHSTCEPLAAAVEAEVEAKLAMPCRFDFSRLFAADLAARGRVLRQMVDAGVPLDDALGTVGLG